jgi:hypothetical protein
MKLRVRAPRVIARDSRQVACRSSSAGMLAHRYEALVGRIAGDLAGTLPTKRARTGTLSVRSLVPDDSVAYGYLATLSVPVADSLSGSAGDLNMLSTITTVVDKRNDVRHIDVTPHGRT